MEELERLEARLVRSAGTLRMWKELGRRHEEVTEIACENVALHAEELASFHRRQNLRRPETRLARAETHKRESSSN